MTTNQEVKKENTNAVAQNPAKIIRIGLVIILIQSDSKAQVKPCYTVFIIPTDNKKPVQETHAQDRKPDQTRPALPVYESPVQKALKKLQDAVEKAAKAKQKLEKAAKQRDKIAEQYAKTPKKAPNKQKLFAQLQKANKSWAKCLDEKLAADAYVKKCADEYIFSFRIKTNNNIQQHTYQRAA